jgi:hypothetical protein
VQWLANNYQWLFAGVGVAVLGFLLKRYVFKEPAATGHTTESKLSSADSKVTGSPVISGQGNTTTIHIGQPPSAPVPFAASTEDKPRPNMRMTGTRVVPVHEPQPTRFEEDAGGETKAVVIQFTNEARQGSRTAGASVKACLVYEDKGVEVLRIIGAWMYEDSDSASFRVDETRNLIVGVPLTEDLIAFGMYRLSTGHVRVDTYVIPPFQIVRVRLTHASSGDVLYEGQFRVTRDPLKIVPYVTGRGDVTLSRSG